VVSGIGPNFWFRWSLRDLRRHWIAVVAIGLVIAIGTGVYAGLSSTSTWRRMSNDASFAAGEIHALRATAAPGTFADEGELSAVIAQLPSAVEIETVTERLVVDTQLEAATADGAVLVSARIIGGTLDTGGDGVVDRVWLRDGGAPDAGRGESVLEAKFADFHGLPPTGALTVDGDVVVHYSGLGVAPEEYYLSGPEGTVLAEADLATLYLHMVDAQALSGREGLVNDVVLTVAPDGDLARVERDLRAAATELDDLSLIVTTREDADAYRVLYEDIDNDQQFFTAFALLVLLAAALAAFNLINRIVEAQRREIGIGMALGLPRPQLAVRPLLVGAQIAAVGVVGGVLVGLLVGWAMQALLESFLPLPEYRTPFQVGTFAQAAALGIAIPLLASAWPIWRAVRVEPIEAIRTGHLTARGGTLTNLSRRIRLPGSSVNQIPLRNLMRAPRRTLLTAAGVGVAIASLVTVLGMLDSFGRSIDVAGDEVTGGDPDRVLVQLTSVHDVEGPTVTALVGNEAVAAADLGLRMPAAAIDEDGEDAFDLVIDSYDFATSAWSPTVSAPEGVDPAAGIVLARKAADDLGVRPGDAVTLRHPASTATGLSLVESEVTVSGLHASPVRTFAYMDASTAAMFGLDGWTNLMSVTPADGTTRLELQRALFGAEGVASTLPMSRISEAFDEALEAFTGFLAVAAVAVLTLALLIAFNAARITVEERRRDHATMRAFGLPVRSVLATLTKESVVIGLAATLVGVAVGTLMLEWMLRSLAQRTLPDFGIDRYVSPTTLLLAAAIGLAAVTIAPLFLVRRLRRMDLPSNLRVME
jgi:putative ABC transport system permease protein